MNKYNVFKATFDAWGVHMSVIGSVLAKTAQSAVAVAKAAGYPAPIIAPAVFAGK